MIPFLLTTATVFVLVFTQSQPHPKPTLDRHIIPLYGNATLGYYYANLFIGTPPQEQSVIADTGSGVLALPCSKCTSCGYRHLQPPFRLQASSTLQFVTCNMNERVCASSCSGKRGEEPCGFSISYAQGSSLQGIYLSDQLQFERNSQGENIRAVFGCTTKETNLFYTQAANGIFGLAPERQNNMLETLVRIHAPETGQKLLFTMCLAAEGGQLVIGRVKNELHTSSESVTTGFNSARNLYSLQRVGQVKIGSEVLKTEGEHGGYYGIFIDSGSTFTYLPRDKFTTFVRALTNACSYHPDSCLIAKGKQTCFKIAHPSNTSLAQQLQYIFPSFDVVIDRQTVKWSPAKYLMRRNQGSSEVCLGVQSLDRYILGANWMVDRDIVFDLTLKTVTIFSDSLCEIDPKNSKRTTVPVYSGAGKQQLSYMQAVLDMDRGDVGLLLMVLLVVVGLFVLVLILLGRCCGEDRVVARAQDQEKERIKEGGRREKFQRVEAESTERIERIQTIETIQTMVLDNSE